MFLATIITFLGLLEENQPAILIAAINIITTNWISKNLPPGLIKFY